MWDALCEWAGAPASLAGAMRARLGTGPVVPLTHICAPPLSRALAVCRIDKYSVLLLVYLRMCCGKIAGNRRKDEEGDESMA